MQEVVQEFSSKEQRKLIWIVVAFCSSLVALFAVLALAVVAIFFPFTYAGFLKGVGLTNLALNVYQDMYENSSDVNDGYTYLMESIYAQNDKHIVFAYDLLSKDEKFVALLNRVDVNNVEKFGLSKNILGSLNEYDYVSGKYVASLYILGKVDEAYAFAVENLNQKSVVDEHSEKSFLLFDYIAKSSSENLFKISAENQTKMLAFSDGCATVANSFIAKSQYNAQEYADALESSVRCVEVFKAMEQLNKAGVSTIITQEQIETGKDSANEMLSTVLKKVVN